MTDATGTRPGMLPEIAPTQPDEPIEEPRTNPEATNAAPAMHPYSIEIWIGERSEVGIGKPTMPIEERIDRALSLCDLVDCLFLLAEHPGASTAYASTNGIFSDLYGVDSGSNDERR